MRVGYHHKLSDSWLFADEKLTYRVRGANFWSHRILLHVKGIFITVYISFWWPFLEVKRQAFILDLRIVARYPFRFNKTVVYRFIFIPNAFIFEFSLKNSQLVYIASMMEMTVVFIFDNVSCSPVIFQELPILHLIQCEVIVSVYMCVSANRFLLCTAVELFNTIGLPTLMFVMPSLRHSHFNCRIKFSYLNLLERLAIN